MKTISLKQIEDPENDPQTIVDEIITIIPTNIPSTLQILNSNLEILEHLREVLFFKKEGLHQSFETISPESIIDRFAKLESKIQRTNVSDISSLKTILLLNNSINDYKVTQQILKTLKNIHDKDESILEEYISNKDKWIFLSRFFKQVMSYPNENCMKEKIYPIKTKFENSLVESFQKAVEDLDKDTIKTCYTSMKYLEKDLVLIKYIVHSRSIFQNSELYCDRTNEIEIDRYQMSDNSYFNLIDHCIEIVEIEIREFETFIDTNLLINTFCKEVFKELCTKNVAFLMETGEPIIFLLDLDLVYSKTKSFVTLVRNIFSEFNFEDLMKDLFEVYFSRIESEEKNAIDQCFNFLAKKARPGLNYMLEGESLYRHNVDSFEICIKIIKIYNQMLKRADGLGYEKKIVNKITSHYIRKIKDLLIFISNGFSDNERMLLIYQLSKVYALSKKIFQARSEFVIISNEVYERIEILFHNRLDESEIKLKNIIKPIDFKNTEKVNHGFNEILNFLNSDLQKTLLYMEGENSKIFMKTILSHIYSMLEKYSTLFIYKENELDSIISGIRKILNFIQNNNLKESKEKYEHILDLYLIVSVKKDDLKMHLNNIINHIPYDQLKKFLKCRMDYKEIKKYIKK